MKRAMVFLVVASLLLTGCDRSLQIDGKKYGSYGLLNEQSMRSPKLCYQISWGNVILGFIFIETLLVPFYIFGFILYEPIGVSTSGVCEHEPGVIG